MASVAEGLGESASGWQCDVETVSRWLPRCSRSLTDMAALMSWSTMPGFIGVARSTALQMRPGRGVAGEFERCHEHYAFSTASHGGRRRSD